MLRVSYYWQALQHITPFSRPPKIILYKLSAKIRFVYHVPESSSPTSPSPTSPSPTSPSPTSPSPTFDSSKKMKIFIQWNCRKLCWLLCLRGYDTISFSLVFTSHFHTKYLASLTKHNARFYSMMRFYQKWLTSDATWRSRLFPSIIDEPLFRSRK